MAKRKKEVVRQQHALPAPRPPGNVLLHPPSELVEVVIRASNDLDAKPLTILSLRDLFGMLPADLALVDRSDLGSSVKRSESFQCMTPTTLPNLKNEPYISELC